MEGKNLLYLVIALVFVIGVLIVYNMSIHKKIQDLQNMDQKIANLTILQDFMNIAGSDLSVDNKIKEINNIIIEKYEVKYSTIVIFDGTDYIIKATNVDKKHWDVLSSLQDVEIFKDSITTGAPKYITINNKEERLPYQQKEFARAQSAIFFPLYIDNVYIGHWLIESGIPHDFDNIDTTVFEIAKDNIITILKTVDYQKILENIVRKDLFSGLNNEMYLYGEGKKIIDKYTTSAICMLDIVNIRQINKIDRKLGNKVITEISKYIKENISDSYLFVRYMGPKFVLVFCGVETSSAIDFVSELKENTEKLKISLRENNDSEEEEKKEKKSKKKSKKDIEVSPLINCVLSTYYKGTGIEEVLKKLEDYVEDNVDNNLNEINSI